MKAPKWLLDLFECPVVGDIVYFKKIEKDVSSPWMVGKVVSVESGRDGIQRRAEVEYHNLGKFFGQKHITHRAVKGLVNLFNVKDLTWKDNVAEIKRVKSDADLAEQVTVESGKERPKSNSDPGFKIKHWLDKKLTCEVSCCISHFNMCSRDLNEIVQNKCVFQSEDLYTEPKHTKFVDVLNKIWDSVEKQLERSERNHVYPGLMGVLAVINKFLEIEQVSGDPVKHFCFCENCIHRYVLDAQ